MAVPSRDVTCGWNQLGGRKAVKIRSLDLPADEDIEPVDHVFDDLVEGVTLVVISALWAAGSKKRDYPYVSARSRTADHRGGRIEVHSSVPTEDLR